MTRSARSSTLTATRASRAAQNQKPPPAMNTSTRKGGANSSTNSNGSKPVAKTTPKGGAQKKKDGEKENGKEDSDDAEESKARVRPKRKSDRSAGSPQSKKSKTDEGTKNGVGITNGTQESSDEEDSKGATSKRDQDTSRTRRSGARKEEKSEEEEEQDEEKEEKRESSRRGRNKRKKQEEEGEEEEEDSDDEVILTGFSRGSKRKAIDTMIAINAMEDEQSESDIEEIMDSDDESGEEGSSEEESEDEEEEGRTRTKKGMSSSLLSSNNVAYALKEMREEYANIVRQKDLEIQRLKNELSFKDTQLEDLNELSTKNMELEASISTMLSGPEGYKAEVEAIAKKKKEDEAQKVKRDEEKAKSKKSDKDKKNADSDIEEINDEPSKDGGAGVELISEEETGETGRPRRKRRSRRRKVEDEEGEKIEALFVSDDEDEELKKEKDKKKKKDDKKSEKKAEEKDIEVIEVNDDEEDDKDKGRHNIRKLMTDKKLASETKAAALEEKERLERVAKLKEKHQIESHIDNKTKQPVYTKMVLAFKKDQKTPLVEVNTKILKKLKPHQVEAVEFLWDSVVETTERLKDANAGSGCILAHCMGLGKTLSVITFVHTLLTNKQLKMKTCLVVCPLNTVLNWEHEWQKWLDKKDRLPTYEMASAKDNHQRADLLSKWQKDGGIMIMGYQIFRILATSTTKSKKKKKIFDDSLTNNGADIVVCDEGHVLKNDASAISKCMNKMRSKRRIVLTGTPLQNNLIEYHCMVSFVKPNLLGSRKEFCNRFVNPITNGQHADSTSYDVKLMKRRAHVLHKMLSGCVQRRDYSALTKFLPPKYEYIISVRLSPLQIKLYEKYLEMFVGGGTHPLARGTSLFSDYQALMRIWTHPWVLKMDEIRQEKKMTYTEDDDDELGSFLASDTSEEEEEEDSKSSSKSEGEEEEQKEGKKSGENGSNSDSKEESDIEIIERPRRTRRSVNKEKEEAKENNNKNNGKKTKQSKEDKAGSGEEVTEEGTVRRAKLVAGEVIKHWQTTSRKKGVDEEGPEKKTETPWWAEFVKEEDHKQMIELSGKLVILFDILRMAEGLGDKVLVFSQSLLTLDLIEDFLGYKNEEAEKLREGKKGKSASSIPLWLKDEDYCRMDGSTSAQNRTKFTNTFNSQKNKRMRLFLISTKAGGLGINLDSANRVIIFDASWNPSHDIQSIFRAYRFGQEKDVFIYRLLAQGTMEEKIYERQVTKETLSQRVIDEHQMDRHFTASDLQELYIFQPDRLDDPDRKERPTPAVPKDIILAELLSERKEWLVGYHEHDSLLEKRPDEDLSEEERKTAWEEYEKEKQGIMHHYRQPTAQPNMYNYNYRPPMVNNYNPRPYIQPPTLRYQPEPHPYMGMLGSPSTGFTSEQAKLNFQLSQLPRVVQEILKYNPNITPSELQSRLRAFMGMHTKYSNVPGFAMPGTLQGGVNGQGSAAPSTSSSTPSAATSGPPPPRPMMAPWPGPSTAAPSASQISQLITNSIVSATTDAMPSRLPLPGRVPANVPR